MHRKPVIQRVKESLGEDIFKVFFAPTSNGSKEKTPDMVLREFMHNALTELTQIKPVKRQLSLRIQPESIVPLPQEFQSVESIWFNGKQLRPIESVKSLRSGEYAVNLQKRIIQLTEGTTGVVELHCTALPKEEDLPAEAKLPLVLHVKAQCCEYIAQQLKKNPSQRIQGKDGVLNNPSQWEQEAQRLRQKFTETARRVF